MKCTYKIAASYLVGGWLMTAVAMAQAVNAQNEYTVTDLGEWVTPYGINNHGEVVGGGDDHRPDGAVVPYAFIYKNEKIEKLTPLLLQIVPHEVLGEGAATMITDNGDIVGYRQIDGPFIEFLIKDGKIISLGVRSSGVRVQVAAVNNSLEMVGSFGSVLEVSHTGGRSFNPIFEVRYTGGRLVNIGVAPIPGEWEATGINEAGEVVGRVYAHLSGPMSGPKAHYLVGGFKYSNGRFQFFSNFSPQAINNAGQMVGEDSSARPALYMNGHLTILGVLPGTNRGEAEFVNDSGEIIGNCYVGNSSAPSRLFVNKGGVTRALLIPGWTVTAVYGLNNAGQIIATANRGGVSHGLLLTPIGCRRDGDDK
jgi:hypothetical protein